jgi:hypothetical protein
MNHGETHVNHGLLLFMRTHQLTSNSVLLSFMLVYHGSYDPLDRDERARLCRAAMDGKKFALFEDPKDSAGWQRAPLPAAPRAHLKNNYSQIHDIPRKRGVLSDESGAAPG